MEKQELTNLFIEFIGDRFPELIEEKAKEPEPSFKDGDSCFGIDMNGEVLSFTWKDDPYDKKALKNNAIFKAEKEAELEAERLKVLRALEKMGRAFVKGGVNWSFYFNESIGLTFTWGMYAQYGYGNYYFDSEEEAKEAVEKVGEEKIKKYLFRVED
ncbi:hypothetical protein [Facklamia hominis]|uniref:hypothetical protein n=1 Tax=Facklamia hominis TaxID=178214 RepID=UPI00101DDC9A|nr:hypothetical protein [Facklamia hominis]RYC97882.1 hypothetical protein EKN08_05870 [Facklamia hominis]